MWSNTPTTDINKSVYKWYAYIMNNKLANLCKCYFINEVENKKIATKNRSHITHHNDNSMRNAACSCIAKINNRKNGQFNY